MPNCKQCSAGFEITSDDLAFYDKVSPVFNGKKELIPPPTLCPECRVQRRMGWRNDRMFYHRKCDFSGQEFISMYAPDVCFPVYKQDAWHGDGWDAVDRGRTFDFGRPFFEQWAELRDVVPHWGVAITNCENSDYCNYCTDEKNCYLDIAAEGNEDCYYNLFTKHSRNCVDCTFVYHSALCYECIQCYNCYGCKHSQHMEDCSDCAFCFDCKGCKNCLLSVNLRNKQYCILNKQYSEEEYETKKSELHMASGESARAIADLWKRHRVANGIHRDMVSSNCEACTGDDLKNCKNAQQCFNATDCEDTKYLYDVLNAKDCYDMNYSLYDPEASYEVISTVGLRNSAFYMAGPYNARCFYSHILKSCSDCFGCVGLKQKKYCLLNKQYTKEEYDALVPKVIAHMRKIGEWGEFFPLRLSPHGYNETVAKEYYPLNKEEVSRRGWSWRDDREHRGQYLGPPVKIPDAIDAVQDDIVGEILLCEISQKPYKIIPQELKFYRSMGIPLPRRCPDQRHRDRMTLRNPRKLWSRNCAKCQASIQTTYAPDRPETVYCEKCYLDAVY